MSKDFSPSIDEMGVMAWTNETWEKTGANFAIEEMKKGKMLDGLILAAQARANPSVQIKKQSEDVKKEFVDDVYTQLTSHIKNFRPEDQGESGLFGWINPQLGNKSLDVQKRPKYSGDKLTRAKDLDAKTEEGAPGQQVADQAIHPEQMMKAAEEAADAKELGDITMSDFFLDAARQWMDLARNAGRKFAPAVAHEPEQSAFDFGDIEMQEHLSKLPFKLKETG